jgi:methionyl-tRNA synthetase
MHPLHVWNLGAHPEVRLWLLPVIAALVIWSLVWKGLALWRSARHGHTAWFVVMLILNTLGILEIIYLLTAGRNRVVDKPL